MEGELIMKLSKLTRLSKKVLAIVLAFAMTFVGSYFMPKTADAAQPGYTDAIIDNDFHTIGTDGWQYKFRGNHLVEYKGGTAYNDSLITNITRSENNDHDFQIKTPVVTVTPGHIYKMTMRIDNYGNTTQGASCYATVTNPSGDTDITSNYNNKVDVPANGYREIELEFTAPGSGQIYSKVNWGWSALCEFKFTPTLEDITPAGWTDCVIDNNLHTIGNDGFQYQFRSPTAAKYKDGTGTSLDEPLDIELTSTVNNDHDFITRSPLVSVTPGNVYRLTYNVANLGTTSAQDCGANIYATVTNASNNQDITSNYDAKVGLNHNDDVDIVLEFTAPASGQVYFKLNNSWTPCSEYILTPSIEDITPSDWVACTIDDDFHTIGSAGFQYKFRGATTARYFNGSGTDLNTPLDIDITNGINGDHDFQTLSPVATLTPGNDYRLTYNIQNLGTTAAQDCGANMYSAVIDNATGAELATSYNDPVALEHGDDVDIVLEFTAPASGEVYFKLNNSYTPATEFILTPAVEDITPSDWYSCTIDNAYHTIGNDGFQYKFRDTMVARYKGGTDIDDPLNIKITNTINDDHDFLTKTPDKTVTPGHIYKLTYNIANEGPNNSGANFYAKVCNAANDTSLATNYDNPVAVNANDDVDIELTFMAPESGEVYVEFNGSYTPVSTYVLTPSFEDTTPDAQPITAGQWGYAGANDTGWSYFARAEGSAYVGGETMADGLTINYGTYVNDTYTMIAHSPITQVDSGKTYTGTMTIKNDSKETLTANNLHVSVHWYNAETGQDGEISAATSVAIPAGESQTFNLSYTAPDSGYILYEASTNYTPGMSSFTFSATHTPPADGRYDVAQYKSGATPTYPEKEDKIFAGWFDDENYSTPHMGNTGLAYAKFIDEEVLTVKFQTRGSGSNAEAVRFVSTVDSMDYQIVGFKFTGTYGDINISEKIKTTEKLYRSITAAGMTIYPPYFCSDSEYFFTYTVRGMNSRIYSSWVVTPFYVTLDGTTVYGRTGRFPS